jgi:hypothetical protein
MPFAAAQVTEVYVGYTPRPLQRTLHKLLAPTHRFVVAVCHRRFGKTVLAINHLQKGALQCPLPRPRLAYIGPTYRQAKSVAWDFLQAYARPIPGIEFNQSELRADYPNGGRVTLYGADNPDSLRGLYLDGVVLDEFGLMPSNVFSEVIRPALADRGGWALFIGTPAGKNQFYDIVQQAKRDDADWAFIEHKASQTGILSPTELRAARSVMTQDEYDQEFECSFDASVKGAIYADQLADARASGRITRIPYEPTLPVDTDWDLGVGDATAIWYTQSLKTGEVRVIDYDEGSGEGLPYYAGRLKQKPYSYGVHWAPHDIQVREFTSGRSRIETAASMGITFQIHPKHSVEDGIHAGRLIFPKCWFDAERCKAGLEALQHYRRDYNTRLSEFKAIPVHDWASHGADAWRGFAVRQKTPIALSRQTAPPPITGSNAWLG